MARRTRASLAAARQARVWAAGAAAPPAVLLQLKARCPRARLVSPASGVSCVHYTAASSLQHRDLRAPRFHCPQQGHTCCAIACCHRMSHCLASRQRTTPLHCTSATSPHGPPSPAAPAAEQASFSFVDQHPLPRMCARRDMHMHMRTSSLHVCGACAHMRKTCPCAWSS